MQWFSGNSIIGVSLSRSFSTTWRRDKSFIVLGCHNDMLWGQLSCQMRSPLTSNCLDICSLEKRTPASWLKLKRAVLRSQFSHKCSLLEKWKSVIYSLSVNLKCWTMSRDSRWMSYETAAILNKNLVYIPILLGRFGDK